MDNNKNIDEPISLEKLALVAIIAIATILLPYNLIEHFTYNDAGQAIYENTLSGQHSDIKVGRISDYELNYVDGGNGSTIYQGRVAKRVCLYIGHRFLKNNKDGNNRTLTLSGYEINSPKSIHDACTFAKEEGKIIIK